VSILEAGASSLPVVATPHAGIPDAVTEGLAGFLVMSAMYPAWHHTCCGCQGAGRRIEESFSKNKSLNRLWAIIETSIKERFPTARPR
jgi:glycosyltransferase involved in cell wall biosynthesis